MKLTCVLLLVLSASGIHGQASAPSTAGVSITRPQLGDVWNAGTSAVITWTITDNSVTTLNSIELRKGLSVNLDLVGQVATNVPVGPSEYVWNIPPNTASDGSYVLVLKSSKGDTYSPYFTIMAQDPNAPVNKTSSSTAALPGVNTMSPSSNSASAVQPSATGATKSSNGASSTGLDTMVTMTGVLGTAFLFWSQFL